MKSEDKLKMKNKMQNDICKSIQIMPRKCNVTDKHKKEQTLSFPKGLVNIVFRISFYGSIGYGVIQWYSIQLNLFNIQIVNCATTSLVLMLGRVKKM